MPARPQKTCRRLANIVRAYQINGKRRYGKLETSCSRAVRGSRDLDLSNGPPL